MIEFNVKDKISTSKDARASGGKLDFDKYTIKHKVITKNRMQGRIAEDTFEYLEKGFRPEKGIQTSDGVRYVDNIFDGTAREVKSGIVKLTDGIKRQIRKDLEIIKLERSIDIDRIEWHILNGIENDVLKYTRDQMNLLEVNPNVFKIVIY